MVETFSQKGTGTSCVALAAREAHAVEHFLMELTNFGWQKTSADRLFELLNKENDVSICQDWELKSLQYRIVRMLGPNI